MDSESSGSICSNCLEQVNKLRCVNQSLNAKLRSLNEIVDRRNQEINNLINLNREEAEKRNNQNSFVSKESYESNLFWF